ncbi:hypothetical protein GCM10010964_24540 [Caldovatus sediminis]|uniref:DUF3106 domain-containing protein n=1 Tax=Caldovatus sediminis TaxID=2041189 RepID=A0A8J2ZC65_9PROT|nr:hypothetical protein [Caldovatus sediminis]GGG35755.1 hypothetical protein GCM10010964_24540 [Caldovatus sediminis]
MPRGRRAALRALALLAAVPLAACARHAPPPTAEVVRRNPWLARHFDELTPPQQARVAQRMRRARPPLATTREDARLRWDAMGLEERRALLVPAGAGRSSRTAAAPRRPAEVAGGEGR